MSFTVFRCASASVTAVASIASRTVTRFCGRTERRCPESSTKNWKRPLVGTVLQYDPLLSVQIHFFFLACHTNFFFYGFEFTKLHTKNYHTHLTHTPHTHTHLTHTSHRMITASDVASSGVTTSDHEQHAAVYNSSSPKALTAICFDVSRSMMFDDKFTELKKALLDEVVTSPEHTCFLIVAFNHDAHVIGTGQPMDRDTAAEAITTLLPEPDGGTAIFKAVSDIGRRLSSSMNDFSKELLVLKIFTDGVDNESSAEDLDDASKVVDDVRNGGGVVTLIQAGSSTCCADALHLDNDAVLYFTDGGTTLAHAAAASREATSDFRLAVLSREPTMRVPTFSYTPIQRAMSVETGTFSLRMDSQQSLMPLVPPRIIRQ